MFTDDGLQQCKCYVDNNVGVACGLGKGSCEDGSVCMVVDNSFFGYKCFVV